MLLPIYLLFLSKYSIPGKRILYVAGGSETTERNSEIIKPELPSEVSDKAPQNYIIAYLSKKAIPF